MQKSTEILFDSIVLIEDNKSHSMLIERALKNFCSNIFIGGTLKDGIELVKNNSPKLIITDLNLPDTTGVSDIIKLKKNAGDIPLIVLTSSTLLNDAVEALKFGARDFVVKNFDTNFREVLSLALNRVYSATALEAERKLLEKKMEILHLAIENGSDGMAILNKDGEFEYCNSGFKNFLTLSGGTETKLENILSDKVKNFKSLKENLVNRLNNLPAGAVWQAEAVIEDEKLLAFDLSLSCFEDSSRVDDVYVLWIKDISELKRRERFQRELLSTTSHDLKGPLGTISLSSELLTSFAEKDSKIYEISLRVGASAQSALNFIDEFLSARRVEEGAFILRPKLTDIDSLFENVKNSFQTIAVTRSIELFVSSNTKIEWNLDELAMQRALGNLISNAIKFTPKNGKVEFSVEEGEVFLKFIVQDNGSGMEASEVQKIFERYSRLNKHSNVEGSGLGLFVTKSVVSAHGGSIEVVSQLGKGTRFEVFIPQQLPKNLTSN